MDKESSVLTEGKLSVIVPVYNAEKFLDKCIQSIRGQTYSNMEIIWFDGRKSGYLPQA